MFKFAVLAAFITAVLAQTPDGPNTTCFKPLANARASDCSSYIKEFCGNVAKPKIFQQEWMGQCIASEQGQTQSCHFYAYNTRKDDNSPAPAFCENVLNAIISDCPQGGGWGRAGSQTAAYTFIVDPDYRTCGDGITEDHH